MNSVPWAYEKTESLQEQCERKLKEIKALREAEYQKFKSHMERYERECNQYVCPPAATDGREPPQ